YIGYQPGFKRYGKKSGGLIKKAVKLAMRADTVLLYIGLDEATETEGLDRTSMRLPQNQLELIAALKATGKKIIAVLSCGAAIETDFTDGVAAVLHGYLGGQAGAKAMLNALTGRVNPSGKLAESYPCRYADSPSASHFPGEQATVEYREGLFVGYRYFDTAGIKVKYPFGYGLSYTSFEYGDISVTDEGVTFKLKNAGTVAGAEVAQLYVGAEHGKVFRPKKELKGFAKVSLEAGEVKTVHIPFDEYTFRYFNVKTNAWEVESCDYGIMIGSSSADIRLSAALHVKGTGAESPYTPDELPSYYSGRAADVGLDEFERLLGRKAPNPNFDFIKKNRIAVDQNTAISDLKYAKGWAGRFFAGLLRFAYKLLRAFGKRDLANVIMLGLFHMPVRGLSRMTGGAVTGGQVNGLLTMFNGRFCKGLNLFFKEGRRRKKEMKAEKKAAKEVKIADAPLLSKEEIIKEIKPLSKNAFVAFFQKIGRKWLSAWYGFSSKKPKLSKLIYQIFFFIVFSEGVTIFQYLVTLFLPMVFGAGLAGTEFLWPKVLMYNAGGQDWFFNLLGYAVNYKTVGDVTSGVLIGGGLGYFIAFEIATFLAQVINFPLQRNITFKSHGNPAFQAMWYFIGWVLTSLFCNGVNSVWLPVANGAVGTALPAAITNIITMVVMGGISMVIFFFIFLIIFPDYNVVKKRAEKKLDGLKAANADAGRLAAQEKAVAVAQAKAELSNAEKAAAKAATKANSKVLAYLALVNGKAGVKAQPGYDGKVAAAHQSVSQAIAEKRITAAKFAELSSEKAA
ncbi:MAG: glycoside hydrolase family 3 C-terminal domain-containing protein, partial [Clostridiales bacterium]|nr:glycoside hydrolase family 3 C-terminal domain-containing protein [Clostridiales bacterium]